MTLLPLADLADVIEAALPVLVGIGWVAWQLISALMAGKNNKKPAPRPVPRPVEADGDAPAPNQDLRSEVDEFLRQLRDPKGAEAAPPAPEPKPAPPRRPRVEVLIDEERPTEPPPRRVEPAPAPAPASASAPTRPASRKSKREPVDPPAGQASRLSQRVAQAEQRVHDRFDHGLGQLATGPLTAAEAPAEAAGTINESKAEPTGPTAAEQIATMLRDPDNVRNAVILNEILRRPTI